jgi:hypothetical protein
MNKRESGYYWVKIASSWIVAFYNLDYKCWRVMDNSNSFKDNDFYEIDERKIERFQP